MSLSWKLIRASAKQNDSNQNEIQDKNQKQDFIESFDQVRTFIHNILLANLGNFSNKVKIFWTNNHTLFLNQLGTSKQLEYFDNFIIFGILAYDRQ